MIHYCVIQFVYHFVIHFIILFLLAKKCYPAGMLRKISGKISSSKIIITPMEMHYSWFFIIFFFFLSGSIFSQQNLHQSYGDTTPRAKNVKNQRVMLKFVSVVRSLKWYTKWITIHHSIHKMINNILHFISLRIQKIVKML